MMNQFLMMQGFVITNTNLAKQLNFAGLMTLNHKISIENGESILRS